MAGRWWRIYVGTDASEVAALLLSLPGVKQRTGGVYFVPENAGPVVAAMLAGLPARVLYPKPQLTKPKAAEPVFGAELREWVPGFLTWYQREAAAWAHANDGGLVVHPTGSGKTITGIVWGLAHSGRILVVTRASARGTWRREVERVSTVRPVVLEGEAPVELGAARLVIVGWETLPAHEAALRAWGPHSIVFDESHKGKNRRRWDVVLDVDEDGEEKTRFERKDNVVAVAMTLSRKAKRRLALTATPIKDRVRDLWGQLDLLEPGCWGNYRMWAMRYCDAYPSKWNENALDDRGKSNIPELKARLALVSHFVSYSETHKALPPKRRLITRVEPHLQTRADGFKHEFKRAAKWGPSHVLEARLAEACSRKRGVILEHVADAVASQQKVVIFTARRRDCETLAEKIRKAHPTVAFWTGHGEDSAEARDGMVQAYMAASGPAVLVGTGDAFGESLNLQDTDLAIMAMLPYTPGQIVQWEGRFTRLGQKRPVLIQYLIAEGTADEHVASLLLDKLPAVDRIVGDDQLRGLEKDLRGDGEALLQSLLAKIMSSPEADVA